MPLFLSYNASCLTIVIQVHVLTIIAFRPCGESFEKVLEFLALSVANLHDYSSRTHYVHTPFKCLPADTFAKGEDVGSPYGY